MEKTLGVKLSETLFNQVKLYATEHDLSMSQVVRHALKKILPSTTELNRTEPIAPAPKSATTVPDDDVVGDHGYTKAELKALALPPHRELVQRQSTLDAWAND
jgi:hypothetical protein